MKLPPTRNHRQLAHWINEQPLVDLQGRAVAARVERVRTSTDSRVAGTRFRRIGKGRAGLRLEIWTIATLSAERLFQHTSSETYRRHTEARAWVANNLRRRT